jgi:hypothetical protein
MRLELLDRSVASSSHREDVKAVVVVICCTVAEW